MSELGGRQVPGSQRPRAAAPPHPDDRGQPPRYAFFDVDGTLIRTKSMFGFQQYYYLASTPGPAALGRLRYRLFARRLEGYADRGAQREIINRAYYRSYRNRRPAQVRRHAESWFARLKDVTDALYVEPVLEALRRHQDEGVEPVLVSGSSVEILSPLARDLGVEHVLATRLETRGERYTGEILPPQMIGDGKQLALSHFLAESGVPTQECFAYGDHASDLPMLEAVGNPRVVAEGLGGDPALQRTAEERGWQVLASQRDLPSSEENTMYKEKSHG